MSEVYAAVDLFDNLRRCAVKLFKHEISSNDILAEAFRRESSVLCELKHENIVLLLDRGLDAETGREFLVLEWVDQTLAEWKITNAYKNWDQFYRALGRPLLNALTYAHTRGVIHRDVKPNNILMDVAGTPKLADFGIAKIKQWLDPGKTLQDWVSRPFSPPEYDDGTHTYTRDVFGFGAVVVSCFTSTELKTYDDLNNGLSRLTIPDTVRTVLARAIHRTAEERQTNCGVLRAELETIDLARQNYVRERPRYNLKLIPSAFQVCEMLWPNCSIYQAQIEICKDLADICGIAQQYDDFANRIIREGYFVLIGAGHRYHVAVDSATRAYLVILKIVKSSPTALEHQREHALQLNCGFTFLPPADNAAQALVLLEQSVEEHASDELASARKRTEEELFQTWSKLLAAKHDLEKARERPLKYRSYSFRGSRIDFILTDVIEEDLVGQSRRIVNGDNLLIQGDIERTEGNQLTLYVTRNFNDNIPTNGQLNLDISAAETAIRRQRDSLDAVRYSRAVRAEVKELLIKPSQCRRPSPTTCAQFFQLDIDEDKQKAVAAACGAPDFLVVEGPPGTGKTTFITELILQTLAANPRAKILLTSQTHVALDNAAERLRKLDGNVSIVRLGFVSNERISPGIKDLLLPNRLVSWRATVLSSAKTYLDSWAAAQGISKHQFEVGTLLRRWVIDRQTITRLDNHLTALKGQLRVAEEATGWSLSSDERPADPNEEDFITDIITTPATTDLTDEDASMVLKEDIRTMTAELRAAKLTHAKLESTIVALEPLTTEILAGTLDEVSEWAVSLLPKGAVADRLRTMLEIHADWESRLGRGAEFQPAVLMSSQVIAGTCVGLMGVKGVGEVEFDLCIVDEASKATPTEILVPLSRSRRWVLVGDPKQLPPYQDEELLNSGILQNYDLDKSDLAESLFDRLLHSVPEECKTSLSTQHRMVPAIGSLISESFYEGKLKNAKRPDDETLVRLLKRPVTWMTSSHLQNRFEQKTQHSFENQTESKVIMRLLAQMNKALRDSGSNRSVAILTGYGAQLQRLKRDIATLMDSWQHLSIEVNTVDAFQGREAEIAIYSVTRSNDQGNIGFLRDLRRLNVALSRGRNILVIVGDHVFARSVSGENPFKRVVSHIESHPTECIILQGEV